MANLDQAAAAVAVALHHLGLAGDEETPRRFVRALAELCHGVTVDPRRHLAVTFPPVATDPGLIVVRDVPFASVCAHHLLPFHGTATVAYLPKPDAEIVGLSKLARLVRDYAARPQVQEQLAADVLSAIMSVLGARGAAVHLRGVHTCMSLRGAGTGTDAAMVTRDYAGDLADPSQPWRAEFDHIATG